MQNKLHKKRMYLETMEKVLADIDKVIIDKKCRFRCCSIFTFARAKKGQQLMRAGVKLIV